MYVEHLVGDVQCRKTCHQLYIESGRLITVLRAPSTNNGADPVGSKPGRYRPSHPAIPVGVPW